MYNKGLSVERATKGMTKGNGCVWHRIRRNILRVDGGITLEERVDKKTRNLYFYWGFGRNRER